MYSLPQYRENTLRPAQDFPFYLYPLTVQNCGPHVPVHWHEEAEIILPSLEGCLEADGLLYPFQKGDILFLNPGQLHATTVSSGGTILHMVFHPKLFTFLMDAPAYSSIGQKLLEGQLLFPTLVTAGSEASQVIRPLLTHMYAEAKLPSPSSPLLLASDFYQLLARLQSLHLLRSYAGQPDPAGLSYVRNAMHYMQQRLDLPLRIPELASYLGISEGYFNRIFKHYTHVTPIAYVVERKLEAAHALLLRGFTVTEAAQHVGIDNISYFIRLYKKKYAVTPNKTRLLRVRDQFCLPEY